MAAKTKRATRKASAGKGTAKKAARKGASRTAKTGSSARKTRSSAGPDRSGIVYTDPRREALARRFGRL